MPIVTGEIYHIFNRGVNKANIFFQERDYQHFMKAARHYRTKDSKFSYEKLFPINDPVSLGSELEKVSILAYCLMPNHFHFLIKQLEDEGITSYFRHLSNSFSHFINIKYGRVGPLFQGRFKNVLIENTEQLLHVSRYIHLNPLVSNLVPNLSLYKWSSYLDYIEDSTKDELVDLALVLNEFKSKNDYEKFISDQAEYVRTLEIIKHKTIDDND